MSTIRQTAVFKASPLEVYEALMDSKKHARFTRHPAAISRRVGGKFKAYGDYIRGVNLELRPGRKIVQSWRASTWEPGVTSRVTIVLVKTAGGTKLTFVQTGVPETDRQNLSRGWRRYYWAPMRAMLAKERFAGV